ncbi:zinc finger protein dzip1l [Stylonychia lemnae]|uniref:Zinc finger protein dzip1l n=1 Tax=Stylonychia lemnae TaxID=5949 RepID=A0A078AVQ4_STYLE|nr:zinc finger protein dzip1l [Stylonychia lemnae]|eukprot:CDW86485.1 zinc finger protein dzip1l [Stylonychia lemnae]
MNAQSLGNFPSSFAPVRESKENLFASNLLPLPPKFSFQERTGRINWRALMNTDLDKISKEVDLKTLEALLQNITFAQLDRDDLERLGDMHFIKLFRLSQYSIEYLLYTQNYMESLCKNLDVEYRQTYEKTMKTEEMIRKYQQELKIIRKELKLKQKTLSTYEYLMKLPVEQEQDVIKCKSCRKFFLSKQYLQKHYQRHHPEVDFFREFADMNDPNYDRSLNERQNQQTIAEIKKQQQINQEELFDKIKGELFGSLVDNFKKLETEISTLKDKQNFQQIKSMLENYEQKNEEEQKKIQDSLNKPAKSLEDLKSKWSEMFQQQTSTIKDMMQQYVNDALSRRKDERDKKKQNQSKNSEYFQQKLNEFDDKFKQNEQVKQELEQKVKDYEKQLQLKSQTETQILAKLQEEEQKRKQEEKLRKEREEELMNQLNSQAQVDYQKKLQEEQKLREEFERKLKEEQEKIKENEEKKIKQLELQLKQEEDEKNKLLKLQEEKARLLEEEKQKAALEQEKKRELQLQLEKEEAEKLRRQKSEEEKRKLAEQQRKKSEEIVEEQVIEEDVEEEDEDIDDEILKKKQLAEAEAEKLRAKQKQEEEERKKKLEEEEAKKQVKKQPTEELKSQKSSNHESNLGSTLRDQIKKDIKKEIEQDNFYMSDKAHIKSFFNHEIDEISNMKDIIQVQLINEQEQILAQEFNTQKIQPVAGDKQNPLSLQRKEDLRYVNDSIKGLSRKDVEKINNSLMKRLSDQQFTGYSNMIEGFLKKALMSQ